LAFSRISKVLPGYDARLKRYRFASRVATTLMLVTITARGTTASMTYELAKREKAWPASESKYTFWAILT
jgi:hypothetical protein